MEMDVLNPMRGHMEKLRTISTNRALKATDLKNILQIRLLETVNSPKFKNLDPRKIQLKFLATL